MLCGNPATFAIESTITKAYERLGFRGLGYFVIHINGQRYGVREPEATMLACSFDAVNERLRSRGKHTATFDKREAGLIANAYRHAIYAPDYESDLFFARTDLKRDDVLSEHDITWAPDGDEAFDDWSFVLQFDVENKVRLIGFKSSEEGYNFAEGTLTDLWISAADFYSILQEWRDAFEAEWQKMPKTDEAVATVEG